MVSLVVCLIKSRITYNDKSSGAPKANETKNHIRDDMGGGGGGPTRSYANQPVQSQKQVRSLRKERNCTFCEAKTKALIGCAVRSASLFLHRQKSSFSHDVTHIKVHVSLLVCLTR